MYYLIDGFSGGQTLSVRPSLDQVAADLVFFAGGPTADEYLVVLAEAGDGRLRDLTPVEGAVLLWAVHAHVLATKGPSVCGRTGPKED